jgi:hypothetical protein
MRSLLLQCLRWCARHIHRLENGAECRVQPGRCSGSAAQMGCNDVFRAGRLPAHWGQYASGQLNLDSPFQGAPRANVAKVNEWGGLGAAVGNQGKLSAAGFGLAGVIGHDGKPRIFRWDDKRSCYVPVDESSPEEAA